VKTPSDTPRSNEADSKWETSESVVDAFNGAIDLCRQLERELAEPYVEELNRKLKAATKTMTTPSDTPIIDEAAGHAVGILNQNILNKGRQLERELSAKNAKIKSLVEAGDSLYPWCYSESVGNAWTAAKEGAK
jgi:hypothetical protein